MAVPTRRTVVGPVVPSRGAITFAWAVSSAIFSLSFVAALVVSMLVIAPVGMRPDPSNPLGVQWDSWASWVCLGVAMLFATVMVTVGGRSGAVWAWADLRVLDGRGEVAAWPRRAARPFLLSAVVVGCMAVRHDLLGLGVGVGLVVLALVSSLAAADRRGVAEKLLGIRDVTWGQVPAPDDVPASA